MKNEKSGFTAGLDKITPNYQDQDFSIAEDKWKVNGDAKKHEIYEIFEEQQGE